MYRESLSRNESNVELVGSGAAAGDCGTLLYELEAPPASGARSVFILGSDEKILRLVIEERAQAWPDACHWL